VKRFWKDVTVEAADGGHAILLDERSVKTPMRADLILPSAKMAEAAAQEWRDVGEEIDPSAMPVTGFANAALDRVVGDRQSFIDAVAAFGESDLFCYRAENPQKLVDRQESVWGKWLRWAQQKYLVKFVVVQGIVHQPQAEPTLVRLKEAVAGMNDHQLAAASKLTHLTGSLVAVLALADGTVDAEMLWPDLILDELWQEEQWGTDELALKNRDDREAEFLEAARFMVLARL